MNATIHVKSGQVKVCRSGDMILLHDGTDVDHEVWILFDVDAAMEFVKDITEITAAETTGEGGL